MVHTIKTPDYKSNKKKANAHILSLKAIKKEYPEINTAITMPATNALCVQRMREEFGNNLNIIGVDISKKTINKVSKNYKIKPINSRIEDFILNIDFPLPHYINFDFISWLTDKQIKVLDKINKKEECLGMTITFPFNTLRQCSEQRKILREEYFKGTGLRNDDKGRTAWQAYELITTLTNYELVRYEAHESSGNKKDNLINVYTFILRKQL